MHSPPNPVLANAAPSRSADAEPPKSHAPPLSPFPGASCSLVRADVDNFARAGRKEKAERETAP